MGRNDYTDMYGQYSIFDYGNHQRKWDPIEAYAKMGSGFVNGKERIINYFEENSDLRDRVAFLRKEYSIGGFSGFPERENTVVSGQSNAKGHEIEYVDDSMERKTMFVTYEALVKIIDKLIKRNDYIKSIGR